MEKQKGFASRPGTSKVATLFSENLEKHPSSCVFMVEVPDESYFDVNTETVKVLADRGYSGIYISINRPYAKLVPLLKKKGIDTEKLLFIDAASSQADAAGKDRMQCIYISKNIKVDELVRAVYTLLPRLKGENKFLFLDSITTLTLYQPLSEALRFAGFLGRTIRKEKAKCVINVAENLAQKNFIRDVVLHVDEVITGGGNGQRD
jgi:KaiC/GvpD/RAD55 family RecA-like ATPase